MDVKALAKSKRSHSVHHSRKHQPNRATKASSVTPATASGTEKQAGKQVKEKPEVHGSRALPSNWDRYNEEGGSGSEDASPQSKPTDTVYPKSKGMDYAHLISEAKAQSQTGYTLQGFPSFDDVVDDVYQDTGPLLSVRGRSILSSIEDDSFLLDDKATASDKHEASFLSLDLTALAEQLAKATIAERLFVELDVLPREMCPELYTRIDHKTNQIQTTSEVHMASSSGSVQLNDVAVVDKSLHESSAVESSNTVAASLSSGPNGGLISMNPVKDDLWKFTENDRRSYLESPLEVDTGSVASRPPRFEAATSEAELDMLLDSFTETKLFESTSGAEEKMEDSLCTAKIFNPTGTKEKEPGVMTSSITVPNLDELLKETSNAREANSGSSSGDLRAAPNDNPSASNHVSKSKLLDDFDSWLDTI